MDAQGRDQKGIDGYTIDDLLKFMDFLNGISPESPQFANKTKFIAERDELKLREQENSLLIKSLVEVINYHKACRNKSFIDEKNLKEAELLLDKIKNEKL